ncbi:polysaccharide lyase [Motiliproteus sp.]|uniref:polysaccharide lyase n=1 Tax=Motiliproteus sp. TaxID=1898955 RepID=UPI003BABD4E0
MKLIQILLLFCFTGTVAWGGNDQLVWDEQATRVFASKTLRIRWQQELGDWVDANGEYGGSNAWASLKVADLDRQQFLNWNVTELVKSWLDDPSRNQGMLLKNAPGEKGRTIFLSREGESLYSPLLVLSLNSGEEKMVETSADTYLSRGTRQAMGGDKFIRVGPSEHGLLYFPLPQTLTSEQLARAELYMSTHPKQYGDNRVEVYDVGVPRSGIVEQGLAAAFVRDQGIERHPDVVYTDRFNDTPDKPWVDVRDPLGVETVESENSTGFAPFDGSGLSIMFSPRAHTAISMALRLKTLMGEEPESMYFRYYLRLGNDWNSDRGGGKFPGFSGTYDRAGWGGRRPDGYNGWSARGMFLSTVDKGPHRGKTPIGNYIYHVDHANVYGEQRSWSSFESLLEKERWYSIEQFIKLNSPGNNDGELKAWVDGRLVMSLDNLRFRDTEALKVEKVWFDFYHGGGSRPSSEQHLFIDNLVVAKRYIGPAGNN